MRRVVVLGAVVVGLALPAAAGSRPPQPIFFWASTANAVSVPKGQFPAGNPRVIRPRVIGMFADGSWFIEKLRWHGWGTRVARASGISNASSGVPDQAHGRRIKSHASVTLSDPGRFKGHEVYRCFELHLAAHPASDTRRCLKGVNGYWYLLSVPPKLTTIEFFAGPPLQGVGCEMDGVPGPGLPAQVLCESATADFSQKARLGAGGRVRICAKPGGPAQNPCNQGNFGEGTPTYKVGKTVTEGPFRCRVLESGVRCVVRRTGKGFEISPTAATRVG